MRSSIRYEVRFAGQLSMVPVWQISNIAIPPIRSLKYDKGTNGLIYRMCMFCLISGHYNYDTTLCYLISYKFPFSYVQPTCWVWVRSNVNDEALSCVPFWRVSVKQKKMMGNTLKSRAKIGIKMAKWNMKPGICTDTNQHWVKSRYLILLDWVFHLTIFIVC